MWHGGEAGIPPKGLREANRGYVHDVVDISLEYLLFASRDNNQKI